MIQFLLPYLSLLLPPSCFLREHLSNNLPTPKSCFRPCLQGNPGLEDSQGLYEIGDTTDEDTEVQKKN